MYLFRLKALSPVMPVRLGFLLNSKLSLTEKNPEVVGHWFLMHDTLIAELNSHEIYLPFKYLN